MVEIEIDSRHHPVMLSQSSEMTVLCKADSRDREVKTISTRQLASWLRVGSEIDRWVVGITYNFVVKKRQVNV